MRPSAFRSCVAALVLGSLLPLSLAAQTAATDPVGFITVNVTGGGTVASPILSLVAPTLLQPVSWQGAISGISGTTISVSGTPWTADQFDGTNGQFFVEVTSGTSAGAWTDITATTTSKITTSDDLSSYATTGSTIRIRKHATFSSFLGATNSAGLLGSSSMANADEVMIYDGASHNSYWYYDASDYPSGGNPLPVGWYDSSFNSAANVVIAPNEGVVIRRKASAPVNFVSMGAVKTGTTFFPVQSGLNVIGTISAEGLTLANSGLYSGNSTTGVTAATSPAAADEITIYSGTNHNAYWYYSATDQAGTAGWYDFYYQSANSVTIPAGASLIVKRKSPGAAFNWQVPSPSSF